MILQLNPTIPVTTPKGEGYALGWIDYSQEHDLLWIVGQDTGEVWVVPNKSVRMCVNWTMGRDPNKGGVC